MQLIDGRCKICNSTSLNYFAHTATCRYCGVLLNHPYPKDVREEYTVKKKFTKEDFIKTQIYSLNWHISSGQKNHNNFTDMASFTLSDEDRKRDLIVLDYGGGGGQFSLILKSLFPKANSYIVDLNDNRLLEAYKPINKQIKYIDFESNQIKFDVIFMNDVFEHLTFPVEVLELLRKKLKKGGRIFIDTPRTFWLYPLTKILSKSIHKKLLRGTVDDNHQQIWTNKSFEFAIKASGYKIKKFNTLSEYTQPADFYLRNMKINNPIILFFGYLFYFLSPFIAKNKIMAVIEKN